MGYDIKIKKLPDKKYGNLDVKAQAYTYISVSFERHYPRFSIYKMGKEITYSPFKFLNDTNKFRGDRIVALPHLKSAKVRLKDSDPVAIQRSGEAFSKIMRSDHFLSVLDSMFSIFPDFMIIRFL